MTTKTSQVFVAHDGKEFAVESDCVEYENKVLERLKGLKFYQIIHKPDLTEGRGHYGFLKVAVETQWMTATLQVLQRYCFENFGSPIAYVQGCAAIANWTIHESHYNDFKSAGSISVGDYQYACGWLFLSNGDPLPEFPKPTAFKTNER